MCPVVLKFLEMKLICQTTLSLLRALDFRCQHERWKDQQTETEGTFQEGLWFTAVSPDSSLEDWTNILVKGNPGFEFSFCPVPAVRLWTNYLNHLEGLADDEKNTYCTKPGILDAYYFQPLEAKENAVKPDAEKQVPLSFQKETTPQKAFCLKAFWEGLHDSWKNF